MLSRLTGFSLKEWRLLFSLFLRALINASLSEERYHREAKRFNSAQDMTDIRWKLVSKLPKEMRRPFIEETAVQLNVGESNEQ